MKVIRHYNSGEHLPMPESRHRSFESAKCRVVRQNRFSMRNANRDEIDDRFLPAYPNRNARRMTHKSVGRRSACPTIFPSRHANLVGQALHLPVWLPLPAGIV